MDLFGRLPLYESHGGPVAGPARYEYLTGRFFDVRHGGYFWELDPQGHVVDDHKKTYGQAFVVYALVEYYRAFAEPRALEQAADLFRLLEAHCHDAEFAGYFETLSCDWQPCEDVRLSEKDMNEKKSMNNHLHLLEAWASLVAAWPEPPAARRLRELIDLFGRCILNAGGTHFHHFFDEAWNLRSETYTYGHDIEGSWLLCEAAEALGDPGLLAQVRALALKIARAVLEEGLDADGGLVYEGRDGRPTPGDKEWWPQAEAVVGFWNAWQLSGDAAYREAALRCWQFIQERIVDRVHGEWFWRVNRDGTPDTRAPKVSAWKCPYHNGRCCLEIIRRTRD